MNFIRVFLWGLVAAMTLQGFLHADDYGSALSFVGGVSMTLAVWRESIWSQIRTLMPGGGTTTNNYDEGLPRSFVVSALQESARHPGLHTLPTLRRALTEHRRAWDEFREAEVHWMLSHADLIGALRSEGRDLWHPAQAEHDAAQQYYDTIKDQQCWVTVGSECSDLTLTLSQAYTDVIVSGLKLSVWERLLTMNSSLTLVEWWNATAPPQYLSHLGRVAAFETALLTLHNVTTPLDPRIQRLESNASMIAVEMGVGCRWRTPLVRSLLLRDLWTMCLQHVHRRESRVHEMMVATGVQDLYNTHERLLSAALRSVTVAEASVVQSWFDAAGNYAWWLSEDVLTIVRRCIGQTVGECRRIGVTEITTLMEQYDERTRIIRDWIRCLFIGMWNAMPAIGLLFIVETVVLLIPRRTVNEYIMDSSMVSAPAAKIAGKRGILRLK
jgi:hypothetical protein